MAWKTLKLSDLLTESKIEVESPNTNNRIRVKLNLGGVEQRPDSPDTEGATKYYRRKSGQFIYGKQNLHKGAFGIIPQHLDGYESSADIPAFDVNEACYPEWIFYFFKQNNLYLKLDFLAKGIGSKRIQTTDLLKLSIPVPDKSEQKYLIEKISEYDSNFNELNLQLSTQLELIAKAKIVSNFEAIQGKLTEKFRLINLNVQSGNDLLKTINSDRRSLIAKNKIKAENKLESISENEIPFTIPKEWTWCRYSELNEFGTSVSYGVLIPENHTPNGIPLIRVGDLDGAERGILPQKYIRKEISEKYKKTILRGGEILIVVVGSSIGKVAIAHENWKGANIARAVSRSVINSYLDKTYVEYVIRSKYIQDYFKQSSHSIGQPTLNINVISKALIPLPSLNEQIEIVKELKALLDYYSDLEKQIISQKDNLLLLSQSYLTNIFQNFILDLNIFENSKQNSEIFQRKDLISYDNNTIETQRIDMELIEVLKEYGKLSAVQLWKLSKHEDNIDKFYEDLKKLVEVEKKIKESKEKGFLELVQ